MVGPVGVEVQLVTSLLNRVYELKIRWYLEETSQAVQRRWRGEQELGSPEKSQSLTRFNKSKIRFPFLKIWTNQPGHRQEDGLSWFHRSLSSPLPRRWFSVFQANWINWLTSKLSFFFTNLDSRVGSVSSAFAALSFQKIILLRQLSTWGTEEVEYNT